MYNKVQFIGYKTNTFPSDGAGSYAPHNVNNERYLGHADDRIDIRGRCQILCDAIYRARQSGKVDPHGATLKVFMAPEFFFRGRNGAYPIELVSSIAETMRRYTKMSAYSHWLFVFGTALGYLKDGSAKEIFNIAFVQKGGVDSADKQHSLLVYKEYISHIDFIRNSNEPWDDRSNRRVIIGGPNSRRSRIRPTRGSRDLGAKETSAVGRGAERSRSGLGGQGRFTMAGIHFGLEVCLDHAEARLRASPPAPGDFYAQVHLIPSAGMNIDNDAIATWRNGLVFNVDPDHVNAGTNVGSYQRPDFQAAAEPEEIDLDGMAGVQFQGQHTDYFVDGPGMVHVYGTLPVPAAVRR